MSENGRRHCLTPINENSYHRDSPRWNQTFEGKEDYLDPCILHVGSEAESKYSGLDGISVLKFVFQGVTGS